MSIMDWLKALRERTGFGSGGRKRRKARAQTPSAVAAERLEDRTLLTIFVNTNQSLGSEASKSVSLGDVDGDGDLDALVVNYFQPSQIWINNGSGVFTAGQELSSIATVAGVLGDVDGDGDLDVFIAGYYNYGSQVWKNNGSGTFTNTGQSLGTANSTDVALGRLDGDSDLDAFVSNTGYDANYNYHRARVWLNNGSGTFSAGQAPNATKKRAVALGDVDRDGDLDAFIAGYESFSQVWKNNGSASFSNTGQTLGTPYGGYAYANDVALGDLDGDGDLDAFVAQYNYASQVFLNGGTGVFTNSGQQIGNGNSFSVTLGDVDGDGDLDAVLGNSNNVEIWLNNGSGVFTLGESFEITQVRSVALGDLDGDGDLDMFVARDVDYGNVVLRNTTNDGGGGGGGGPPGGTSLTLPNGGGTYEILISGANLIVRIQGGDTIYSDTFTAVPNLTITGSDGDDTLIVNYSAGAPIPTGGLTFNAGNQAGSGDTLRLTGGSVSSVTHTFTNSSDGTVAIDGRTVAYTGLEPILDQLVAVTRTFTFGDLEDEITLSDGAASGDGLMRIASLGSSETVDFAVPTGSLTINAGIGDDVITLSSFDSTLGAGVTITVNGDSEDDVISAASFGRAVTINGGGGADSIVGSSQADLLSGQNGNDTIDGGSGGDIIRGQNGNDSLVGGGGADTLEGETGDDVMVVPNVGFGKIDGGANNDLLILQGSGHTLNLTSISNSNFVNLETLDITGSGDNTLTLDASEVEAATDGNNTLVVKRDTGDTVNDGGGWTVAGTETIGGSVFDVYTQAGKTLKVQRVSGGTNSVNLPGGGTYVVLASSGDFVVRVQGGAELFRDVLANLSSFTVNGSSGDDSLIVDFSGGNPIPSGGLTFHGGSQSTNGDRLTLTGGTATTLTHTFASASSGSITIDASTVNYTGLEPITDNMTATNRVFTFGGSADNITLSDGAASGDGKMRISSVSTSETVDFTNPTASLTINAAGGNDSVTLASVDSTYSGTISVLGGDGNDTLSASALSKSVTLSGGAGNDLLSGGSGADSLAGGTENDTLNGGTGADVLRGEAGNDSLVGGGGADTLEGSGGDDVLVVPNANFGQVLGGSGSDTLVLSGSGVTLDLTVIADVNVTELEVIDARGTGNNTVTLNLSEVQAATDANNTLRIRRDAGDVVNTGGGWTLTGTENIGGENYEVYQQGGATLKLSEQALTVALPAAGTYEVLVLGGDLVVRAQGGSELLRTPMATAPRLTIDGSAGDDTLVVDYTNGSPIPAAGLYFNGLGQGAGGDKLVLTGGSATSVTHTFTNASDGTVSIDGRLITYTGLEPITDNLTAADRVFNFDAAADTVTLSDGPVPGDGMMRLSSAGTSETVDFKGPTSSLTINAGAGNDAITLASVDSTYTAGLVVNGGDGHDTLTASALSRSVTLSGGTGDDSLTGGSGDDSLSGNTDHDTLVGGLGADILRGAGGNDSIVGGGGADTLEGSTGDDVLVVPDAGFGQVLGGSGNDTLVLSGAGITLDLTAIPDANVTELEVIDARGTGNNTVTLNLNEVVAATEATNTLRIRRDVGDVVNQGSGWTLSGTETIGGSVYEVYQQSGATLKLSEQSLTVVLPAAGTYEVLVLGGDLVVRAQGGAELLRTPMATAPKLTIDGTGGDDTVVVDYSNGSPIPVAGLFFNGLGQGAGGDRLRLTGGSATSVTHTFTNATDGTVSIDGRVITYTGIEPITDELTAANRLYSFGAAADSITLGDGPAAGDGKTRIAGTAATQVVDFKNPTGSLRINAGDGNDTVTLSGVDSTWSASLTVDGQGGGDVVNGSALAVAVTLLGGAGDDVLSGSSAADSIAGDDGADTINGNAGADRLEGGAGNDLIGGDNGNDTILGHAGNDTLLGGGGDDSLEGNADDDSLIGGGGADSLKGGGNNDTFVIPDANFGLVDGSTGVDKLVLDAAGVTLDLTAIADTKLLNIEDLDIRGSGSNTLVFNFNEVVAATEATNVLLIRRDVDDTVTRGPGWNFTGTQMIGGVEYELYAQTVGATTATFKQTKLPSRVELPASGGTFEMFRDNLDLVVRFQGGAEVYREQMAAVQGQIVVIGSSNNDTLVLDFTGGDPVPAGGILFQGNGQTTGDVLRLTGGTVNSVAHIFTNANDGSVRVNSSTIHYTGLEPIIDDLNAASRTFTFGAAADDITLSDGAVAGDGKMRLSSVSSSEVVDFQMPSGSIVINAGDGNDTVTIASLDSQYAGTLLVNGEAGDDRLNATAISRAVTLLGGAGSDLLLGGAGHDSLAGENGADTLTGAAGNDSLNGGAGIDRIVETAGGNVVLSDTQLAGPGTDTLVDVEEAHLTGTAGADTLDAGAFSGAVTLLGLAGTDSLRGGQQGDWLVGGDGADTLNGRNGNDTLDGGNQDDRLFGGAGADSLAGGAGNDTLKGQGGLDSVEGGAGDDEIGISDNSFAQLIGGDGTDVLLLEGGGQHLNVPALGGTPITSMERIDIRGTGANTLTVGFTDVVAISGLSGTLIVLGNADDAMVVQGPNWIPQGTEVIGGDVFDVFTRSGQTLKVQEPIVLTIGQVDLQITARTPAPNSHTAPAATNISATFDTALNVSTVTPATFIVHAAETGKLKVPPSTLSASGSTLTFDPALNLHAGERVQVTATLGIRNVGGQTMDMPVVWDFRTATTQGTGIFFNNGPLLGNSTSTKVALGDLDGDGDIDAFVANFGQPNRVWLNNGDGTFTDSGQLLDGSSPSRSVVLGDFDGDGDLDAFVARGGNHPNLVFLNNGSGVFSDSGQALGSSSSQDVVAGDFDGDGDLDVFVANATGNIVYLNNGSGSFTATAQVLGDGNSWAAAIGDVDRDGDLDVIVANFLQPNELWLNNGNGLFTSSGQMLNDSPTKGVALGDVDGDGDLDALFAREGGGNVLRLNNGSGVFGPAISIGSNYSTGVQMGDLDGDGDLDFIAHGSFDRRVWLNDGAGNFIASTEPMLFDGFHLALADLDRDGDLDVFVAGTGGNSVWRNRNQPRVVNLPAGGGVYEVLLSGGDIVVRAQGGAELFRDTFTEILVPNMIINGSAGDDRVIVDFVGGSPIPMFGLYFHGGAHGTADVLELRGGTVAGVTHSFSGAGGGAVTVDGRTVYYTGLEPIIDDLTAADRVFTFAGSADEATLSDDGFAGNGISRIASVATSSPVDFKHPTNTLRINAGSGNDTVQLAAVDATFAAAITVMGDDGDDVIDASGMSRNLTLLGGNGNDSLLSGSGQDSLHGGAGLDTLNGGAGHDTLDGDFGSDVLTGGPGNDSLMGGPGTDTLVESGNGVFALTSTQLVGNGTDVLVEIERAAITGGAGNDTINATAFTGSTTLSGGAGHDVIDGGSGSDVIYGGEGSDTLNGRSGADSLFGEAGSDALFSGGGTFADWMDGGGGDDVVKSQGGADSMIGGAGNDVLATNHLGFAYVNGQEGHDTLRLDGAGHALDLSAYPLSTFNNLEGIDITGGSTNTLTVTSGRIISATDAGNTLMVIGETDDHVSIQGADWTQAAHAVIGVNTFHVFQRAGATLMISEHLGRTIAFAPLLITSTLPAARRHAGAATGDVTATFNHGINPATVSDATFVVHAMQTGRFREPASAFDAAGFTVAVDPAMSLHAGELVQVTATTSIRNLNGAALARPVVWQFQVAATDGTGQFFNSGQSLGSSSTRSVALGDLDGDGDLDALIGNIGANRVWLNDGNGNFTDSGQSLDTRSSYGVALGDLDGDGDLDAFVANNSVAGQPNTVWFNNGLGVFTSSGQFLGNASSHDVKLADLDGDGDLDAFIANGGTSGQPNEVWFNDGAGTFTNSGQLLGNRRSSRVVLGDVDGDGDTDAVVANLQGGNRLYLNNGSGLFTVSVALGPSTDRASDAALGDVDGDGDLDIFLAKPNAPDALWLNDGSGNFTLSPAAFTLADSRAAELGDVDGDGDLDIVVSNGGLYGPLTVVWLNNGSGSFTNSGQSFGSPSVNDFALVDLDGDGDLDQFAGDGAGGNAVWLNQNRPRFVSLPSGGGTFEVLVVSGNLVVRRQGGPVIFTAPNLSTSVPQLTIDGSADDDVLIVDYSGGSPIPAGGLIFNGGPQTSGDALRIQGGNATSVTHNFTSGSDGTVNIDGKLLTYTGLEPIVDQLVATNRVFNFGSASDQVTLSDGASAGDGRMRISSSGTSETVDFLNPTGSLTINTGAGSDTVTVASLDALFAGSLVINGDDDNDLLDASALAQRITLNGLAGNDTLIGGGGNDMLRGGNGNDTLDGRAGNDTLDGGSNDDVLTGGLGADSLIGGSGSDRLLESGSGHLVLTNTSLSGLGGDVHGGIEQVQLAGGDGADTIDATAFSGAATLIGGGGADSIEGTDQGDLILGGDGDDTVNGRNGNDTLVGEGGNDNLRGGSGADVLDGGLGDDTVRGHAGNDTLTGGSGSDLIDGGTETDRLLETVAGNVVLINTGMTGLGMDTLAGVEESRLTGGGGNDGIHVAGFTGNVTVNGGAGDDTITVADITTQELVGGDGTDELVFSGSGLVVNTTALADAQVRKVDVLNIGGSGANSLTLTLSKIIAISDDANTLVVKGNPDDHVTVLGPIWTPAGTEVIGGQTFDVYTRPEATLKLQQGLGRTIDVVTLHQLPGTGGTYELLRSGADVVIRVQGGTELFRQALASISALRIDGSAGDDTLIVSLSGGNPIPAGGVIFNGGAQTGAGDKLVLTGGSATTVTHTFINGSDGAVNIDGKVIAYTGLEPIVDNLAAVDRVFTFAASNDSITLGDNGVVADGISRISSAGTSETVDFVHPTNSLRINAGDGADTVTLTAMDSTYTGKVDVFGGNGHDRLNATAFPLSVMLNGEQDDDTLLGGAQNDILRGNAGNDWLDGAAGGDTLDGGNNDDVLIGGAGADSINGGSGSDTVIASGSGSIVLTDSGLNAQGADSLAGVEAASITGGSGSDTINASGFSGSATLSGEDGNDWLIGGSGSDVLNAAAGDDTVEGNAGDDSILGGAGRDLISGGEGADTIRGQGGFDTLNGDGGNDWISGDAGDDLLNGNSGNDTLMGGDDHDTLLGGAGADLLDGGEGDDQLRGQGGADTLLGSGGNDWADGGEDHDLIEGAGGRDTLFGDLGNDTLQGGAGDDELYGGADADSLLGDVGDDWLFGDSGGDTLDGFDGNDGLYGDDGSDRLNGGAGDDTLLGGNGNDSVFGGAGRDLALGGAGDDLIDGQGSTDTISGGTGNDTLTNPGDADVVNPSLQFYSSFNPTSGKLTVLITNGVSIAITASAGNVQVLVGGTPDPNLGSVPAASVTAILVKGDGGHNLIDLSGVTPAAFPNVTRVAVLGGAGNDTIIGSGFADWLIGEAGTDSLVGNAGNDTLLGGEGDDVLSGNAGNDVLSGELGHDSLHGNEGHDTLMGGDGDDTLTGAEGSDFINGEAGADLLIEAGDVHFTLSNSQLGGLGADTLGGIEAARLTGGAGANRINAAGFSGATTLTGGAGADTITGGSGVDRLVETFDSDMTLTNTALTGPAANVLASIEEAVLTGGGGNNVIDASGFSGAVTIDGGLGNDSIRGGGGADSLLGGDGNDTINGGAGNDRIDGGNGDDGLAGGIGNDWLSGGAGADSLLGGNGDDTLLGGSGNDVALGGQGIDRVDGQGNTDTVAGGGNSVTADPADTVIGETINDNFAFNPPWAA